MATKSRMKRRAFRNPKRARRGGSNWFNVSIAIVIIIGSTLVMLSRNPHAAGSIGPKLKGANGQTDHWHAALGVNVCGKWEATPIWPTSSATVSLGRADNPTVYAGLHTHVLADGKGDGIIHMEPATSDEAGRNATLGTYMTFGGWKLSASSIKLWPGNDGKPITRHNGEKCGNKVAKIRWSVGLKTTGTTLKMAEQKGNPSGYKLYDGSVIAIYFVPADQNLTKLGDVPSIVNLSGATARGESAMTTPTTASGSNTTLAPKSTGASTTTIAGTTNSTSKSATTTTSGTGSSTTSVGSTTTVVSNATSTPTT